MKNNPAGACDALQGSLNQLKKLGVQQATLGGSTAHLIEALWPRFAADCQRRR
jgi:hypothetical protein